MKKTVKTLTEMVKKFKNRKENQSKTNIFFKKLLLSLPKFKNKCYNSKRKIGSAKMYNAVDVARYIINYSNKKEYGISNLRLQKLLYFVQAYYLAFTQSNQPCFCDQIEAWDFGPVIPNVYQEFKRYGSGNIPSIQSYIKFEDDNLWSAERVTFDEKTISECDKEIINEVVDKFSEYSTSSLVSITHNQRPWKAAYVRHGHETISQESIKGYFES